MNGCINKGERNGGISDHFDIKLLEDLMEVLSKEQFDEVTSLFIKNADDRLNELILFSREEELKKLESSAHSLKGSSSNLGAKKISSMCATIVEYARRNEKAPNLDGLIAEIAEELGYVNEYFIKKTGQG